MSSHFTRVYSITSPRIRIVHVNIGTKCSCFQFVLLIWTLQTFFAFITAEDLLSSIWLLAKFLEQPLHACLFNYISQDTNRAREYRNKMFLLPFRHIDLDLTIFFLSFMFTGSNKTVRSGTR